jgi:hypothetical protein
VSEGHGYPLVKNFSTMEPQPGPHLEGMDGGWTENYFPFSSKYLPKHDSFRPVSVFTMLSAIGFF